MEKEGKRKKKRKGKWKRREKKKERTMEIIALTVDWIYFPFREISTNNPDT